MIQKELTGDLQLKWGRMQQAMRKLGNFPWCFDFTQGPHQCSCIAGFFGIENRLQTDIIVVCQLIGFKKQLLRHFYSAGSEYLGYLLRFADIFDLVVA